MVVLVLICIMRHYKGTNTFWECTSAQKCWLESGVLKKVSLICKQLLALLNSLHYIHMVIKFANSSLHCLTQRNLAYWRFQIWWNLFDLFVALINTLAQWNSIGESKRLILSEIKSAYEADFIYVDLFFWKVTIENFMKRVC